MKEYLYNKFYDETLEEIFKEQGAKNPLVLKKEYLGADLGIMNLQGNVRLNEYDYLRNDGRKTVFFELSTSCGDGWVIDVFQFIKKENEEITTNDFLEAFDKERVGE